MKEILDQLAELEELHFGEKVQKLNEMKSVYGDLLLDAVKEHVKRQTESEWLQLKSIHSKHTAEELVDIQWEHVSRSAGIEFTVENKDDLIQITATKCPLADMAHELNAAEWGYLYYCSRSPIAVENFSETIGFTRSKTLMQNDEYCNHCYHNK